jgi:flagellar motor switch protein FliN/FliY
MADDPNTQVDQETQIVAQEVEPPPPENALWAETLCLPVRFSIDLQIPRFTVRDLLKLEVGSIVDSYWELGRDIPLQTNGQLIGWGEFEVVENQLAVRLTEFV